VWRIPPAQFRGNHFAVFPEKLVETPILAGCPEGGIVLDPFMGSGTTVIVAKRLNRKFVGIEINNRYIQLALNHIKKVMYKNIEML
jgi:DNA modification methylase